MARQLTLISTFAISLAFFVPAHAQSQAPDSPSLGDVARQAKKDKANKPVAKVFTNDDMSASAPAQSSASPTTSSAKIQAGSGENAGAVESPADGMEKLQSALNQLASLDQRSLAAQVLDGNEANFPGRAEWEQKLFAAKQVFVNQTQMTLQKAKAIAISGEGMKDIQDGNDPRVKSISAKLDQLVQDAQRNRAAFQEVVAEGRELASQSAGQ